MNMTNELLQMAQVLSAAQTRSTGGAEGGRRAANNGNSGFDKLLKDRAEPGGTKAAEQPGPSADASAEQPLDPRDETLREVAAAMTMLMTQSAPPQIQTGEILPEELQIQTASPVELAAALRTDEGTALPGSQAQAGVSSAELATDAKTGIVKEQGAPDSQTIQNPELSRTSGTPKMPDTPAAMEITVQSGGGDAQAQDETADLARQSESGETSGLENADAGAAQPLFRKMEAVPVKVGETPLADTTRADLDEQLAGQVSAALKNGAQQVKLRLNPDNLGTLTIDLTRTQDGALQVVFHTTTEKAADLLGRHAEGLSAMLQSGSQSAVQVEVRRQEQAQQYEQQNQQQNQQHGQGRRQHDRRQNGEDFLQQLRLGLVTLDGQTV